MTPLDAMIILHEYKDVAHKSEAADHVVSKAHAVLTSAATKLMKDETGSLCTTCWGDGFHRSAPGILSGPCQACDGTGFRVDQQQTG